MVGDNIFGIFSAVPKQIGEARCIQCQHEWRAEIPIGNTEIVCPNCKGATGFFKFMHIPEDVFKCAQCENDLYFLVDAGAICARCGEEVERYG